MSHDPMRPAVLKRLGHYEILATLGAGGMGEVYKARDTRLGRTVAIKVAKAGFSDRAEREARAVAALSHPHICQLYDIGTSDSSGTYLVMEYVDGETLEMRLAKGALALQEALTIASQIAGGLAAAHRNGIIHRDLKPSNIMLTGSGVKLLDFGLARIDVEPALQETTEARKITEPGTILGTFQYMAPEQLQGKPADARTDIFAFGSVLYEMLTGSTAFQSDSQAGLISSIMLSEPAAISTLRAGLPRALVSVVHTCLRKDPEARWQSAHDLRLELELQREEAEPAPAASPSLLIKLAWPFTAALLLIAATILAAGYFLRRPEALSTVRSSLLPPPNWSFERGSFALSPDGKRLAFVAFGPDGVDRLWVRSLSASTAQQLAGTEGAWLPFWSPDNRRIGFFARGTLNIADVDSAAVRILCQAPVGRCGASWNRNGTIVFAPLLSGPLYRVEDTGGAPVRVTKNLRPGSAQSHRWPYFLPDGKHFLYCADWGAPGDLQANGIYAASLDGGEEKLISSELGGNVAFAANHLLYGRDNSLRMRPFDPDRLQLSGAEISIAEQELPPDPSFGYSQFSVSQNGALLFQALADSASKLTWFDSAGKELDQVAEFGYRDPRISPDGRLLAVASDDARTGKLFICVYDFARSVSTRVSEGPLDEDPAWSPDGKRITYSGTDGKTYFLKEVASDGGAASKTLLENAGLVHHADWSPDGELLFADFSRGAPRETLYKGLHQSALVLADTNGAEGRFSPDGRWIAYTGSSGIVIQSMTGAPMRMNVSSNGGAQPVWARDGRSLFYIAPDRKLMVVPFQSLENTAGTPRVLFQTRIVATGFFSTQYDVSIDGRFLINSVPANYSSPLTLISGWLGPIKR